MLPTDQDDEFVLMIEAFRNGSEEAGRKIIELYGPHVREVVHHRLGAKMRSAYDSEDFVQAVWASLIRIKGNVQCEEPDQLAGLLAKLANNKVIDEVRRRHTQKYDITRQRSLDDDHLGSDAVMDARSTPSQFAIANEEWRKMVEGESSQTQQMLELRRDGKSQVEIAEILGCSERTVRRTMKRVAGKLTNHEPAEVQ